MQQRTQPNAKAKPRGRHPVYVASPDAVERITRLYQQFCRERQLFLPEGLLDGVLGPAGQALQDLIYWPDGRPDQTNSLSYAIELLDSSFDAVPVNLLPILPVDEASIACIVCEFDDASELPTRCDVVRWFLGAVDDEYQAAILDRDVALYLQSVAQDIRDRNTERRSGPPSVMQNILRRAQTYYRDYVEREEQPRSYVERPIQLACQNVIIALATLQHDSSFDGLRVVSGYLTCEVPHLATHEADRALCAALLCDAFQNGSTMEVRFGPQNRETHVPMALRRFGRSLDIDLGAEDPFAVTPREARELFLAVTPMPDDLRIRSATFLDHGVLTPERLCFTLMSSTWPAIELDYILATSHRAIAILKGGSNAEVRGARLSELEVCRAALMTGMLYRRLSKQDRAADADRGVRVYEDTSKKIIWSIEEERAQVSFANTEDVPWRSLAHAEIESSAEGSFTVIPRALAIPDDIDAVREIRNSGGSAALLVPTDMAELVPADVPLLVCPDRLAELDQQIERKLTALRTGR